MDQENVVSGVDLHSKISSQNSGVFVSTKKADIKLHAGSVDLENSEKNCGDGWDVAGDP
jgi:hypothetical protein